MKQPASTSFIQERLHQAARAETLGLNISAAFGSVALLHRSVSASLADLLRYWLAVVSNQFLRGLAGFLWPSVSVATPFYTGSQDSQRLLTHCSVLL